MGCVERGEKGWRKGGREERERGENLGHAKREERTRALRS